MTAKLICIACDQKYDPAHIRYRCDCQGLLYLETLPPKIGPKDFDQRLMSRKPCDRSGVWRFREAVLPGATPITHPEGGTGFYQHKKLSAFGDLDRTFFKHEGENPTGSFKDRGMTAAITKAVQLGMPKIACASTGNTSAALAAYAAQAGLQAFVFLPSGKVATGKLAQTIGYGAKCLSIKGDFDAAMDLVQLAANDLGMYLVNSVNPFRLEGQKTIIWEILQDLEWQAPDWIIVPGGNLGNTSAFGKAIREAYDFGWITKKPRLATIQASGANPFYRSFAKQFSDFHSVKAETVATAIRIGNPVNFAKAKGEITALNGVVDEVSDGEIMAAKGAIDRVGIGCEPASACSLAGLKKLRTKGIISKEETAVCILTGHMLKDPEMALRSGEGLHEIDATLEAVSRIVS